MEFKPDFNRLKKVLLRDGEPDMVPFYELFADAEIIRAITGKPPGPQTVVEFYYQCGYDYVPVETNFGYEALSLNTDDTAALPHEKRSFPDENRGIIESRRDFDVYKWPSIDKSAAAPVNEIAKYLPDGMKIVLQTPDGAFSNVIQLMGFTPFSFALNDDEQLIWDMSEKVGTDSINVLKICLENTDIKKIGAVVLGDDMGFIQSTMISPELLRKYVFPWHRKMAELVHNYELPFILHSCGNLEDIMDDLIDYVGIDAKHSFEDKILPVTDAKKKYGGRIAILGGVDVSFLCMADEKQIREYVDEVLGICAPGGGYALGTGNSVANYIPVNNYLAMLDEGRKKGDTRSDKTIAVAYLPAAEDGK